MINYYQRPFFFKTVNDSIGNITQIDTGKEILHLNVEKPISNKTSINNIFTPNNDSQTETEGFSIQNKINKKYNPNSLKK